MATSVYFNGKMRTLPGVYSTITSGDNSQTRTLDYGVVLLIDTGTFEDSENQVGWGGGSGSAGENLQGKDAVYEFEDITSFQEFVKGGMYYKAAEALFTPDPSNSDAVGISRLLFARACKTTAATLSFAPTGAGSITFATIDEGYCANGKVVQVEDSAGEQIYILKYGYAITLEAGEEDETAFILKFWQGTYTGDYTDPVTGDVLSFNELTVAQSDPLLIAQSDEFHTINELLNWCQKDSNFGARFLVKAKEGSDTEITDAEEYLDKYTEFSGATEDYGTGSTQYLDDLLKQIADVDYNIMFSDQTGDNGNSAKVKEMISHRNQEAKFDKFVYTSAYSSKADFEKSVAMAKALNNAYVVCVHGGVATASDSVASGLRWWDAFYMMCQVIGRVSGKPPYVPVTNKTIGGDKLQHIPTEKEQEKAIKSGLVVVYPNPYLNRFVVLQGVTTLQDNTILFNKKGESFSIQFMRIIAQLNKECVVNAEIDLMGDENGVNINTLSKGALETWTINFLQSRVATDSQDNLIISFKDVVATRVDDYYKVTYKVCLNNEVTKIFFTGFILRG